MPSFTRFVKFAYFQNNTLFFVLNHNAGKQEFSNSVQNIKSVLNLHTPQECSDQRIDDIKAFVTHTPQKSSQPHKVLRAYYKERATGELEVNIKDEKLNALVRSIQEIIKEKHDT